ncbi:pyruvate dehydrogenase E1 component subunit alpha-1, mitochondrial-like [Arachis stenosperma]|uniref:pyruvate dehydrogenase E1 component subunit alpha-1, mitochondrial-like n=1 Tax=Arachis stenosperma TaxID=217475 RepID=UPI0025AD9BB5|nr:pyruvate dehydrogenase E1 component subunit alpha-1, mitochondrial-like [Arachis stenosperma]
MFVQREKHDEGGGGCLCCCQAVAGGVGFAVAVELCAAVGVWITILFLLQLATVLILEIDTYRYHRHSMSDPGSTYRTCDEISNVRQERDPIERVRKLLLAHGIASEKALKDIEKQVRKDVDDDIAKAKECPMPDPSELFTRVYVKGLGVEKNHVGREIKLGSNF